MSVSEFGKTVVPEKSLFDFEYACERWILHGSVDRDLGGCGSTGRDIAIQILQHLETRFSVEREVQFPIFCGKDLAGHRNA